MDLIHIGDTVDVNAPNFGGTWHGEVLSFPQIAASPVAKVRCVTPPDGDTGPLALRAGIDAVVSVEFLNRAGDPEGMREDGCDDVDVTGRTRPYHRHAVTGEAHAHPNGDRAHTHTEQPGFEGATIGPRQPGPPDPVEILARHFTWTGDLGANERSIRAALTELVAGPWHLVTYEPHGGLSGYETSDDGQRLTRATITQEWRP